MECDDHTTDPPFKKRKIKPSLSVLDCTMKEVINDNEIIGSKGIKKIEFVRLLIESLSSLGYKDSKVSLEKESGVRLCSSVVSEFIDMILDGNWDQSLNLLRRISNLDECVVKMASFVILEQKFLEFLDGSKVGEALSVLRNEISILSVNECRVRELSTFLLCGEGVRSKAKSKGDLLSDLEKLFPSNVMIPQGRLLYLVEQAIDMQRDACSFHNSLTGDTLFSDHNCGKGQIPSQTSQVLQEHQDEVWFVEFSHSGKFLASCSKDKSVIVWEVGLDGRLIFKHRLFGHNASVSGVSWSPNDDQILTCGVEENVRRWDLSSGECVFVYEKSDFGMISCNWSPDGKRVFTGFNDKSIVMWDLDGNELESWKGQKTSRISDLQVTSDGKFIISISGETMVLILEKDSGDERLIEEDHNIVSFSLSGDNKFLLVSLMNQEIHLWSIDGDIRLLAKYKGHKCSRFVVRACFGGVEQAFVASGSEDSLVYIWHRVSGELIETLRGHSAAVNCISWNPVNPHMLASASDDRTIRIWGLNM